MNYGLAKELKDAGFSQNGKGYSQCPFYKDHRDYECDCRFTKGLQHVYIPPLSELIEACGDDFQHVMRDVDGMWIAHAKYRRTGKTPDVAVARLWLSLNPDTVKKG